MNSTTINNNNTITTTELWKDIPGYEGIYQVSTEGRVKSLSRKSKGITKGKFRNEYTRILSEKILSPQLDGVGYVHYRLTNAEGKIELWKRSSISRINFLKL